MLILTRRISEKIFIIDNENNEMLSVSLLGIKGNQARIGFNASDRFTIHREEIVERIRAEKEFLKGEENNED